MEGLGIDSLNTLAKILRAEMSHGEIFSTFKLINGSFCPEGGNAIKHGRALDGGCLIQNGLKFFILASPLIFPLTSLGTLCSISPQFPRYFF